MDDLDLGSTIKGFAPGQKVFTRYTLSRVLGRGGMGVVWLARDDKLERDVALKFLPEVLMGDKLSLSELKRETRRSLDLTHSHIVRIYDFVDDGRTAAIAMEFIAGETLTNARVDRPGHCFDPGDIAKWVSQLCSALDYAHTKAKVVHRDLKPANLMIDSSGDLKVTDFGIATSISDSVSRVSKQTSSSGTPVYMAPQQMMGDKPAVTDDIYSIGATLYDLLTGKPPFHTGNIVLQVQNKIPPTVTRRRAEMGLASAVIPEEWESTIASCLAKNPIDRPQSAGEVAVRLGLALPSGTSRPPTSSVRTTSGTAKAADGLAPAVKHAEPARPMSKIPLYVGLAAALLGLGGAGWYWGVHLPEQKRIAAEIAAQDRQRAELERLKNANKDVKAKRPGIEADKSGSGAKDGTVEPSATPPPLPPPRSVRFTGLPPGAVVKIDDRSAPTRADGTAVFELRTGRVRVTANAPSYLELVAEYEIQTGTESIALAMEKIPPPREVVVGLGQGVEIKFKLVPAGPFNYGSLPEERGRQRTDLNWTRAEIPANIYIAETETTQQQHRLLTGKNPSVSRALGDENRPVEQIAWRDLTGAGGVLEKMSEVLRKLELPFVADLPTELEWECAARAGQETAFNNGQNLTSERDDPALNTLAHYARGGGPASPAPVASLKPNAWGLFDMHGNVAEWAYSHRGRRETVLRGGHWKMGVVHCRVASRIEVNTNARSTDYMGYRLVLRPKG